MKKNTKRTAAAAAALLLAASVTAGSLFENPADLLSDDGGSAVVYQLSDGGDDDGAGAGGEENDGENRRRPGPREVLRRRILRLPLVVRLLVVLPLWGVGSAVLAAAGAAWALLSPFAGRVGGFALLLALLTLSFAAAAKAVFPDLPLKKIFSRRGLAALALGAAALAALDAVLGAAWAEYAGVKNAVLSVGFFLALSAALVPFALREQRRRAEALEKARSEAERAEAERKAREPLVFTDAAGSFAVRVDPARLK